VAPQCAAVDTNRRWGAAVTTGRDVGMTELVASASTEATMRLELRSHSCRRRFEPGQPPPRRPSREWCAAGVGPTRASRLQQAARGTTRGNESTRPQAGGEALEQGFPMEQGARRPGPPGCGMAGRVPEPLAAGPRRSSQPGHSPPGVGSRVSCQPELRCLGQVGLRVWVALAGSSLLEWPRNAGQGQGANRRAAVLIPVGGVGRKRPPRA